MAVSRSLHRLLRIRDLQEDQCRLVLESALSELHRLESALTATVERDRQGRSLIQASAQTGEFEDRLAGIEETRSALRHAAVLAPRIDATGEEVAGLRQDFLLKRMERRQAETLIQETEARDAVESGRRSQQALDGWYNSRLGGEKGRGRDDSERTRSHVTEIVCQANATPEEIID
jgi:hypothetical protein